MAVPAWAGLVLLEPPSLCWRLFDDEVASAGLVAIVGVGKAMVRTKELCRPILRPQPLIFNHPSLAKSISAPEQGVECKVH